MIRKEEKNGFSTGLLLFLGFLVIEFAPSRSYLIINELNYNEFDNDFESRGAPGYEFIELYDGGPGGGDLSLCVLVRYNQHGFITARMNLTGRSTDSNGFFLIGGVFITSRDMDLPGLSCNNGGALALYQVANSSMVQSYLAQEPFSVISNRPYLVDLIIWREKTSMAAWLYDIHGGFPPSYPENSTRLVENKYNTSADESLTRCGCCGVNDRMNLSSFQSLPMTPKMPNVYCEGIFFPPTSEEVTTTQYQTTASTSPSGVSRATSAAQTTTQWFVTSPGQSGSQSTTVCVTSPGEMNATSQDFTFSCPTVPTVDDPDPLTIEPFSACPWMTNIDVTGMPTTDTPTLPQTQNPGCGPPPVVPHAWIESWTGNVTTPGSTVTYSCKNGYSYMIGPPVVTCEPTLSWSIPPACYKDCQALNVTNATMKYSSTPEREHSSTVDIKCAEGFYLSQAQAMLCDNGYWVPGSIQCKPLPPAPAIPPLPMGLDRGGNDTRATEEVFIIEWGKWLEWTSCTASCGQGLRLRVKLCNPTDLNCTANPLDIGSCYTRECPVDGEWLPWSAWSNCSFPCDAGTQERRRGCEGPYHEGRPCPGRDTERSVCQIEPCPDTDKKRVKKIVFTEGYTESDERESAEAVGAIATSIIALELAIIFFSDVNPWTIYRVVKRLVRLIRGRKPRKPDKPADTRDFTGADQGETPDKTKAAWS